MCIRDRITTGVKLINLKEGVSVASIAKVVEDKTLMPPEEAKEETDESENSGIPVSYTHLDVYKRQSHT